MKSLKTFRKTISLKIKNSTRETGARINAVTPMHLNLHTPSICLSNTLILSAPNKYASLHTEFLHLQALLFAKSNSSSPKIKTT